MYLQKGFSLIEVLISLMLVTTLGLILVHQQGQTKKSLTQLILRTKAYHFLDHVQESLFVGIEEIPIAPDPYHFSLIKSKQSVILRLELFDNLVAIIRKRNALGIGQ